MGRPMCNMAEDSLNVDGSLIMCCCDLGIGVHTSDQRQQV